MPPLIAGHTPVLLAEAVDALAVAPGGTYVDATIGGAGHALAVLERSAPDGRLLGLDRDAAAVQRARATLQRFGSRVCLIHANFAELGVVADTQGFTRCDGILLDLGISSSQLEDPARGFSFRIEGPLDMRLDRSTTRTAAELVNELPEAELADLIYRYGEERRSRRVARSIVAARPVTTTTALASIVARAVGGRAGRIHPATRTFQALRIAVNDELDAVAAVLPVAIERLAPGGRLAVIAFHSLEDRIVKRALRDAARDCVCPPELPECRCDHRATVRLITRRPVRPSASEVDANSRARSARLRVAERLPQRLESPR